MPLKSFPGRVVYMLLKEQGPISFYLVLFGDTHACIKLRSEKNLRRPGKKSNLFVDPIYLTYFLLC